MSDQGDAGQWRPATTNQNDRYAAKHNDRDPAPDDTTGPLPAVSEDEPGEKGFPSLSPSAKPSSGLPSWADDDAPTGGFPAVSPPDEPEPPAPAPRTSSAPPSRSLFEPVGRLEFSDEAPEDSGPTGTTGTTPRFGTGVPAADDQPSSFDTHQYDTHQYGTRYDAQYDTRRYGTTPAESDEPKPYEPPKPAASEPPRRSAFGTESAFGSESWTEPKYGAERKHGAESKYGAERGSVFDRTESTSSTPESYGSYGLPPKRGVTAEDEAEENDFFAPDGHQQVWDKVVAPSGPPPKPGKPSSGNLRLPDWMREEQRAAAAGAAAGMDDPADYDDEEVHSRRPLWIGLSVLVVAVLVAGGVYALKGGGGEASNAAAPSRPSQTPAASPPAQEGGNAPQPTKQLPRFKGVHTKSVGRVTDQRAGLSYAHLAAPWAVAPKNSPLNEIGFSASQFAVTEKAGGQPKHWARLMSAQLSGAAKQSYQGPGTERAAAADLVQVYEARMFNFRHRTRRLADQPLTVGGHKGWLVSDYVTYRRTGLKATGDIVALAVVDTGKRSPGVLYMTIPNTSRKLWPDVNFVVRSLRVG